MNRTVTVATARVMKRTDASGVIARAPSTPTVAGAAAPVLITQTASAVAVPRKIQNACATNAGAAHSSPFCLLRVDFGRGMIRYVIDNDLMEVLVLKNNFKSYKETKRREIRTGFVRLRNILQDREKELMEAVENIELQKQRGLVDFADYTTSRIAQMDSLIQYSKEALKENSQVAFLQSAHPLVTEIEDLIATIYQPSPSLREDPISYLKVDFEEISENLKGIFPSLSTKVSSEKMGRFPYSYSSELMFPHNEPSLPMLNPLEITRSTSLTSVYDQSIMDTQLSHRSRSSPPLNLKDLRDHGMYSFWDASDTLRSGKKPPAYSMAYNQEAAEENFAVPGVVVIYQTLVYPTYAKIYWTCPTEDVDSFEVAYYEVVDTAVDNSVQIQLIGVLTEILQQNLEIQSLVPNTEYLFKVRAVNQNGPGPWSEVCKPVAAAGTRYLAVAKGTPKVHGAVHFQTATGEAMKASHVVVGQSRPTNQ
ncbi:hypothetical protein lerEdw1_008113, partial [Lerista edwardsae]